MCRGAPGGRPSATSRGGICRGRAATRAAPTPMDLMCRGAPGGGPCTTNIQELNALFLLGHRLGARRGPASKQSTAAYTALWVALSHLPRARARGSRTTSESEGLGGPENEGAAVDGVGDIALFLKPPQHSPRRRFLNIGSAADRSGFARRVRNAKPANPPH